MAVTRTDIANQALARISQQRIADIDDAEVQVAVKAKEFYEPAAREALRSHPWNCCMKFAELEEDPDTLPDDQNYSGPTFAYRHFYHLPEDFVRAIAINEDDYYAPQRDSHWEIIGEFLATDDEVCKLRYVYFPDSPDAFDPMLTQVVVTRMASRLANSIADDLSLATILYAEYRELLQRAKRVDVIEGNRERRGLYEGGTFNQRYPNPIIRARTDV